MQVVRYTALFSGVLYGWYHRRTVQAENQKHQIEHAIHNRERLIAEARDAWKRKQDALKDTTGQTQVHFLHMTFVNCLVYCFATNTYCSHSRYRSRGS